MQFLTIVVHSCAYILQSLGQDCSIHVGIPQMGFSVRGVDMYEGGVPAPLL